MLKIGSSVCLSFGEFEKNLCITKPDEQTNAHLLSLTRPGASRRIKLKRASSHQPWLTQGAPVLLQLSFCILDYTEAVGKYSNILKVYASHWLAPLWCLCCWPADTWTRGQILPPSWGTVTVLICSSQSSRFVSHRQSLWLFKQYHREMVRHKAT